MIAEYASMNGIAKQLDVNLKESTVRTWKAKYLAEVRLRRLMIDDEPSRRNILVNMVASDHCLCRKGSHL